jgi:hypothetical protein
MKDCKDCEHGRGERGFYKPCPAHAALPQKREFSGYEAPLKTKSVLTFDEPLPQDWRKEIDEGDWLTGTTMDGDTQELNALALKAFITRLLSTQRKEPIAEVQAEIDNEPLATPSGGVLGHAFRMRDDTQRVKIPNPSEQHLQSLAAVYASCRQVRA